MGICPEQVLMELVQTAGMSDGHDSQKSKITTGLIRLRGLSFISISAFSMFSIP